LLAAEIHGWHLPLECGIRGPLRDNSLDRAAVSTLTTASFGRNDNIEIAHEKSFTNDSVPSSLAMNRQN
jgi:hypothetical protein